MLDRREKAQRARERRERLKARGLCIACGQPRVPGNQNYCEAHREYHRAYRKAHANRAALYARERAKRRAYRRAHPYTCQWCGRPIDPARFPYRVRYHPRCALQHERTRPPRTGNGPSHPRAARAWQARKRQAGCCVCCGKPRGAHGTSVYCRRCADHRNARRTQRWRDGARGRREA